MEVLVRSMPRWFHHSKCYCSDPERMEHRSMTDLDVMLLWDGGPCTEHASTISPFKMIGPTVNFKNILRPRQNGRHFAHDIFNSNFLNGNVWISMKISLKFVSNGPINNIPSLVQIMTWRRPGDKSLSEPMVVRLPTHICVTRPQSLMFLHCRTTHLGPLLLRWIYFIGVNPIMDKQSHPQ